MSEIYTLNEGKLEEIAPFEFLRGGIENKDKCAGQAKNEQGEVFNIFPAPCDDKNGLTNNCYCAARAVKVVK